VNGAISLKRIELMIAKAREPSKALQKPYLKRNPGTKAADNPKIIEFKTKKNKPKVRIINGKVNKVKVGSKSAFKMPKTAAVINALPKLSISTPIGSLEIIKKLIAVTSQVIINPSIKNSLSVIVSISSIISRWNWRTVLYNLCPTSNARVISQYA